MATNPRIPSEQRNPEKRPELVPDRPLRPQRPGNGVPGLMLAIIVAAALIAAILYYLPRAPKRSLAPTAGTSPVQPINNELQFSAMQMSLAPTGGAMNLDGQVMNAGTRPVLGAVAELTFYDSSGKIVEDVRRPLAGMAKKGNTVQADSFATDPIKPNQTRLFRITVDRIPAGWNHQMPGMKIATVAESGGGS